MTGRDLDVADDQEKLAQRRVIEPAAQQSREDGQQQVAGDGSPQDLLRQALADPAAFAERMRSHGVPSQGVPAVGAPTVGSSDPVDQIGPNERCGNLSSALLHPCSTRQQGGG